MRQTKPSIAKSFQTEALSAPPGLGCVLMASGNSSRFGSNKLLASFRGEPLICRILSATDTDSIRKRIVVTRSPEVAKLCRQKQVDVLLHAEPYRSDTVRLGLDAVGSEAGCLFCSCDQPLLTRESIEAMGRAFFAQPAFIYRLSSQTVCGNPILFPKQFYSELRQLSAGKGGSYLIKKYPQQVRLVPAASIYELKDIDTPADLSLLEKEAELL